MKALRQWLSVWMEWLLLGIGIGCLGTYAYETVEARRFQAKHAAAFARFAQADAPVKRSAPAAWSACSTCRD